MNEFDYDVRQKKIIARSARNVKRAASKKVTLPCDFLTPAQWRKQNGEVKTYSMKKPMTYLELNRLPHELQVQYIEGLQAEYNVNQRALAQMLGVTGACVSKYFQRHGIHAKESTRMTKQERARWADFIHPANEPAQTVDAAPEPPAAETKQTPPSATLRAGALTFEGPAGAALRQVYELLRERRCSITVTWTKLEE